MTNENVLFIDDLAELLKTSRRTLYRRLKSRAWCLPPELPAIDFRRRWSRAVVEKWLTGNPARNGIRRAS